MQWAVDSNTWLRRGFFALSVLAAGAAAAVPPLPSPHDSMPAEDAESLFDEAERARAHAQMPSTMYASTPSEPKPYYAHPLPDAADPPHDKLDRAYPQQTSALASGAATGGETAEDVFRQHISGPVVQAKCVNCHVSGGTSGHTRLVFVPASTDDHETLNFQAFEDLLTIATDGTALVLDKIKGARTHGGGIQIAAGTAQYGHMRRFLQLLDAGNGAPVTVATLFDTVHMQSARKTLYQAAVILAGRIPTPAEYASLGGQNALRAAVRKLMTGPGFHEFLIRGANDRLLTDARLTYFSNNFVNEVNESYRLYKLAGTNSRSARTYSQYHAGITHGATRAPLELIAHVAENDLPYTEILTADYIMANAPAAVAYGHRQKFNHLDDIHDFQPVRIVGYYHDDGTRTRECDNYGCRIVEPGVAVDYPHAGVLNTASLLYRHPTTPTNRNRARARWAYYHFLGIDVETLGARALDIGALSDEENPTMNNPACTACHELLDPVAGTFQNYDAYGRYRTSWRGRDSLPDSYKDSTRRLLFSRQLPLQQRATLFDVELDERSGWGVSFQLATDDEAARANLDKLTVLDANGRWVFDVELESASIMFNDATTCRSNAPNGAGSDGFLTIDSSCIAFTQIRDYSRNGFKRGTYRFELVAWSSEPTELRTTLRVPSLYEPGDTWFRDMRAPGFDGESAPDASNSLEWLGDRIAEDDRFAEATVKFWWPAIMGRKVATPPTNRSDADFEGKLLAAQSQHEEVQRLARMFRTGIGGGQPYNLKDLLTELVVSKWFMAAHIANADPARRVALRDAGASRPLTPEELVAKMEALTGFVWGRLRRTTGLERDRPIGRIARSYSIVYGGIDSRNVTERNRRFTVPMGLLAKKHAGEVAVPVVAREFFMLPANKRRLFAGIELDATPETAPEAIREKLVELHERLFGEPTGTTSKDVQDAYRFLVDVWRRQSEPPYDDPVKRGYYGGGQQDHRYLEGILDDALFEGRSWFRWNVQAIHDFSDGIQATEEEMRMMEAWSTVLAAMLMDYRFLHL